MVTVRSVNPDFWFYSRIYARIVHAGIHESKKRPRLLINGGRKRFSDFYILWILYRLVLYGPSGQLQKPSVNSQVQICKHIKYHLC